MVFYVRGISTNLKFSLGHFATDGVNAIQLVSLFWEAVSILEITCNLWVIALTSDGASSNRRFYRLLGGTNTDDEFTYKIKNLVAVWRFIYLFADGPHLTKTARNILASSGSGSCTKYLWNNGLNLLWEHVTKLFYEDSQVGLKLLPKLTNDHINLNSYSKMTVKYAVQVLSASVSKVMKEFGTDESKGTATFCEMMDNFFDCMNVRSYKEADYKRKPFLKPYSSQSDPRFDWLKNVFIKYLRDWKASISNRPGEFSKTEKAKMFLSQQTYEGLIISSKSLIECVRFLLSEGMECVLTERFCQDPVEEYFGAQRKLGRRSENPDFYQCLYNDNTFSHDLLRSYLPLVLPDELETSRCILIVLSLYKH